MNCKLFLKINHFLLCLLFTVSNSKFYTYLHVPFIFYRSVAGRLVIKFNNFNNKTHLVISHNSRNTCNIWVLQSSDTLHYYSYFILHLIVHASQNPGVLFSNTIMAAPKVLRSNCRSNTACLFCFCFSNSLKVVSVTVWSHVNILQCTLGNIIPLKKRIFYILTSFANTK